MNFEYQYSNFSISVHFVTCESTASSPTAIWQQAPPATQIGNRPSTTKNRLFIHVITHTSDQRKKSCGPQIHQGKRAPIYRPRPIAQNLCLEIVPTSIINPLSITTVKMSAQALNKIAPNSPSRQNPSELEQSIAQALFDLESNTADLKAALRPLQIVSAREVRYT